MIQGIVEVVDVSEDEQSLLVSDGSNDILVPVSLCTHVKQPLPTKPGTQLWLGSYGYYYLDLTGWYDDNDNKVDVTYIQRLWNDGHLSEDLSRPLSLAEEHAQRITGKMIEAPTSSGPHLHFEKEKEKRKKRKQKGDDNDD